MLSDHSKPCFQDWGTKARGVVLCLKLHLYELLNINCYVSFQINRRAIAFPGPEGRRVAGLEGHWDSFGGCCPTRSGCGHHRPLALGLQLLPLLLPRCFQQLKHVPADSFCFSSVLFSPHCLVVSSWWQRNVCFPGNHLSFMD